MPESSVRVWTSPMRGAVAWPSANCIAKGSLMCTLSAEAVVLSTIDRLCDE